VRDLHGAGEVGQEDEAGLQGGDEQRLEVLVVPCELAAELAYTRLQLLARQVDLSDAGSDRQLASSSR
jgi:hypothetical protein